ncbi:MAG: D-cysteine desulfhydrase family protein [Synechococcus sp.]
MPQLHQLPRALLGFFPTPVVELARLSAFLNGPKLWMKRDDQTGLALGGNKTRKLEFLIGAALAAGADTVVTGGAAQSNHCRQTAAAAALCGLDCHLALGGTAPAEIAGNLLLDRLFNARIHWSGDARKGETIPHICAELEQAGRKPYVIPYGGSNPMGAAGFVEALHEINQQSPGLSKAFTHMVFASSSGGTQAGLMVGQALYGGDFEIIGIAIDKEPAANGEPANGRLFSDSVLRLANETARYLEVDRSFSDRDLVLRSDYVGDGYGMVGDLEREAIAIIAQQEGVLLDPVYTGRAMGGLLDMIRAGELTKSDRVLFWHTGGAPALFAYSDRLLS